MFYAKLFFSTSQDVVQTSTEKVLIKKLLSEYQERGIMGRPVERHQEILTVKFGLSLIQILDLDERNQVLTTNVWVTYVSVWIDCVVVL